MAIWHSPLARASQTAQAIADAQPADVPLISAPGMTEIAQGEWEGQPGALVRDRWAAELAAWRRTPTTNHAPGGESLAQAAQRVKVAWSAIADELRRPDGVTDGLSFPRSFVHGYADAGATGRPLDPWAVLVAHDGIFRVLVLTLFGLPLERFWSFPFSLCAISVVTLQDGVPVLRAHNLSEHLAPLAAEARAAAEARGDRRGAL